MNFKKKIISYVFLLALTLTLFYSHPVEAKKQTTYSIDHSQDHKKAKKWADENYALWKKKLSKEENKSLIKLLEPIKLNEKDNMNNINYQLKIYGGDLEAKPIDTDSANKKLKKHIDRIRYAINRQEGYLDKPLIVYKNEKIEDILHIEEQFFRNQDGTLNEEIIKDIKPDFTVGLHSEFGIFDLYEDTNKSETVKWKLELPAGTHTGLIGEDQVVIDKDSAFKVNAIKIIPQKGKQLIRVEASLIPKAIVQQKNNQLIEKIQHKFTTQLKLPNEVKFLNFKLTGPSSHFIATKIEALLEQFTSWIHPSVIRQTLQFMREKKGFIIFTDQKIYTLPLIYEPFRRTLKEVLKNSNTVGYYNVAGNRTISVNLPYGLQESDLIEPQVLFHEFGHAVDHYGAKVLNKKQLELSQTREFKKIFKKEGSNLTEYGRKNSAEFFAEAFWIIHSPYDKYVADKAPEAYLFIKKAVATIANHNPQVLTPSA